MLVLAARVALLTALTPAPRSTKRYADAVVVVPAGVVEAAFPTVVSYTDCGRAVGVLSALISFATICAGPEGVARQHVGTVVRVGTGLSLGAHLAPGRPTQKCSRAIRVIHTGTAGSTGKTVSATRADQPTHTFRRVDALVSQIARFLSETCTEVTLQSLRAVRLARTAVLTQLLR